MENLLSKLIQQAKVEARDALRLVVLTLNGLAGIHILGHWVSGAVSCESIGGGLNPVDDVICM